MGGEFVKRTAQLSIARANIYGILGSNCASMSASEPCSFIKPRPVVTVHIPVSLNCAAKLEYVHVFTMYSESRTCVWGNR